MSEENRENMKIVNYNYNVIYKIILRSKSAYKYEIPYKRPYEIIQMCNNDEFKLYMVATV